MTHSLADNSDNTERVIGRAEARSGTNPWGTFLESRSRAIDWLHEAGSSDSEIAEMLSTNPKQVTLIRTRDRKWDPEGVMEPRG